MDLNLFVFEVFVIFILLNNCEGSPHSKHTTHTHVDSSVEAIDIRNQTISETNSTVGYLDLSIGTVERVLHALPSPTQILHYGKQALIGVPEEIASNAKRFLCSKVITLNDIVKEYHPESDDVNFEFLTQDQDNITISLSTSEYLFNHPKFHMNWNMVLFVTGWNTVTSDEIVSALYDAYRCRGGYNFVVLDTSKFVNSMYAYSELSTEPLGELIGDAIKNLIRYVPYDRIHLIDRCWSTSCSMNHAYQFYAKTIYPGNEYLFNATKCESFSLFRMGNCNGATTEMPLGISTPNWARGKFYLKMPLPNLSVPDKTLCND